MLLTSLWSDTARNPPPEGQVVMTRICDRTGERNVQPLKRRGRLWFFANESMYVYYTPTHWRELTPDERAKIDGE